MQSIGIVTLVDCAEAILRKQTWRLDRFATITLFIMAGLANSLTADEPTLTFFAWSDQHVQTDGSGDHLKPAIDAMNQLPGKAFPQAMGGEVQKPAFVFGCGDISEWPTRAALKTYESLITKRLQFPAYDVVGNHDEGRERLRYLESENEKRLCWFMDLTFGCFPRIRGLASLSAGRPWCPNQSLATRYGNNPWRHSHATTIHVCSSWCDDHCVGRTSGSGGGRRCGAASDTG